MTTTSPATAAAFTFDRRAWTTLLVLCTAVLFEGMSLSGINVQLADIRADLALGPDQLQLVAGAFLVAYAGLLLAGGTCADRWGGRRVFLAGVAVFGAGSLGAALAQDALPLVAARAVQGAGAAITAPAAVSLIVANFPEGAPRNRALGVFSAMGAAGFSLGVVTSGLLTEVFGWQGGFVLYVPLTVLVLVIGSRVLRVDEAMNAPRRRPLPYGSALLATGGLAALIHGVGRVGSATSAEVTAFAGAGLLAILAFLAVQWRSRSPLLPLSLVADRRMAAACVALGGAFAGITGAMFLVATDLQDRQGYSALAAGLAFLPQGIAVGVLSTPSARLADRRPPTLLLLSGLAVITVGQLLYTTVWSGSYITHLLPAALLVGAGIAVAYPAAVMLASAAARENQGTASGALVTCQQAGGALGVAAVTGIQSTASGVFLTGPLSLWACFGFAALALLVCSALLLPRRAG
ncbi:MFS transporter [Streptomyces hawaiiensis]|uniref:MFS transporter n=1 Tax=Streptomyces hawaiiensis TaxID=67305 RepID=UPI003653080D